MHINSPDSRYLGRAHGVLRTVGGNQGDGGVRSQERLGVERQGFQLGGTPQRRIGTGNG